MPAAPRRPRTPRRSPKSASAAPGVREQLSDASGWLKELGIAVPSWVGRFLFWWKHFGLKQGLAIFSVVVVPIINTQWTSAIAGHLADTAAEYYGVDVKVGKWSGAWLGAHATAHDVVVSVPGPFAKADVFRADAISVDLSVLRRIRSGYWIKDVTVDRPHLYLERTLSGRWNWEEVLGHGGAPADAPVGGGNTRLVSAGAAPAADPTADSTLRIEHLEMKDLRIEWVERLPANSGSGLIQTTTATLYVDDVRVNARRIGARDGETPFSLEGRTSDGLLSITGALRHDPKDPGARATIQLENVGAAAMGRLSPNARLMPASGTVSGRIELLQSSQHSTCRAELVLRNVTYTVNPFAPLIPVRRDRLQAQLIGFTADGQATVPCDKSPTDADYRLIPTVMAGATRDATRQAPAEVQSAASADFAQVMALNGSADIRKVLQNEAADALGRAIGGTAGEIVKQTLRPGAREEGNAVTRGLKGVGGGIKRLFGGGGDKKPKPKPKGSG